MSKPYFDFSIQFKNRLKAIVTKRELYDPNHSEHENRARAASSIGVEWEQLAIPMQIHSHTVQWVTSGGVYNCTDGLVTDRPEVTLTLQTADCVPLFAYDPHNHIRGLVHAGWRGTTQFIVSALIEQFVQHGSDGHEIFIIIGPAICQNHFEVGVEIAELFDAQHIRMSGHKYFADLQGENSFQLQKQGIPLENIHLSGICTYGNTECCSYRRDGDSAGRMFAFMGDLS